MDAKSKRKYDTVFVHDAVNKWLDVMKVPDKGGLYNLFAFATFIGDPYENNRENIVDTENPEIIRLIDLINGPNGATILKMLKLKNDERKAEQHKG